MPKCSPTQQKAEQRDFRHAVLSKAINLSYALLPWTAAFFAVFVLALLVRAYRIGELPFGWHVDEAGMAYDMYSLIHYGTDRYYKFNPVYFIHFGGGQHALYGYVCAFFMKLFGLSLSVIRIPAVLSGMVTWLFGTLILREYFEKKFTLLGSFMIAVLPCFILQSRIGLESLLFLSTSTAALYFMILSVRKEKWWLYGLTGCAFGISLYTYAVSYLVVPIFLVLMLSYLLYLKKLRWKYVLSMGVPLAILAAPLILMIIINTFELPEIATVYITIPRLPEYRGSEVSLKKLLHNIPGVVQSFFFKDDRAYNSLDGYFTMYVVSIPFILLGVQKAAVEAVRTIREKKYTVAAPMLFWLTAQTLMGLLIDEPNVNKLNGVFFSLLFFAVYGIWYAWKLLQKKKSKTIFLAAVTGAYTCFFVSFACYYFGPYTEETFPLTDFADCYDDILDEYADVIGDHNVYVNAKYIYYALGEKLPPQEMQVIELGEESRGNVYFVHPREVDENGFYILIGKESILDELREIGFTIKNEGFYTVCYKE